jgi:hypothetical protein
VEPAQLQPVAVTFDTAPRGAQVFAAGGAKLFGGADAGAMQAALHRRADAAEIAQLQRMQLVRQIGHFQHCQPIGFAHVGRGLGQKFIWRDANRTADRVEAAVEQGALDVVGDRFGMFALALAADQPARHFVDRAGFVVRNAVADGVHQLMVDLDIARRPAFDQHDVGTLLPRFPHRRAGFHAEGFGFVAGGDAAGGFGHHRHNADRATAQAWIILLLHRSEVRVEVDEKAAQGHGVRILSRTSAPTGRAEQGG